MSNGIKLLPCPFCGGEAEIRHYEDYTKDFASVYKYYVECTECKAQSNMKANTEDIIKDWNTRKPMDRIVEELEKEKTICFLTDANTGNEVSDLVYRRVYSALDEAIKFCEEKSKNIKLKAEPQVFIQIAEWLELLKWYQQGMEDIPSESGVLPKDVYRAGYIKGIDDVMAKAKEIQEEQIKNLKNSTMRNGKRWAIYMNTYLGHIQVACKRLIAEQLKEGSADNEL